MVFLGELFTVPLDINYFNTELNIECYRNLIVIKILLLL